MFGAILGDIAGSRFEFSRPEKFNYRKEPFFTDRSFFTDDTVMTVATKYAVLNGLPIAQLICSSARCFRLSATEPCSSVGWREADAPPTAAMETAPPCA